MRRLDASGQGAKTAAEADASQGVPAWTASMSAQEAKSARTRSLIYDATVRCLDEHGYAETSVLKVQTLAGVSRGALTHQHPTKTDMMVAVSERLLDVIRHTPSPRMRPRPKGEEGYVEWLIMFAWDRFVHTREGRALAEIFTAMRTDAALGERLTQPLAAWRDSLEEWFLRRLTSPGGDEEVRELVRLYLTFARGLLLGDGAVEEEEPEAMVRSMARLLSPRLRRRSEGDARSRSPAG